MNREQREVLKYLVDQKTRIRVERGRGNCDPEHLTKTANELDEQGFPEMATAIRNFRDKVVNPLMGEGWSVERIEEAAMRRIETYGKL